MQMVSSNSNHTFSLSHKEHRMKLAKEHQLPPSNYGQPPYELNYSEFHESSILSATSVEGDFKV